jgi:hypothetical protein
VAAASRQCGAMLQQPAATSAAQRDHGTAREHGNTQHTSSKRRQAPCQQRDYTGAGHHQQLDYI